MLDETIIPDNQNAEATVTSKKVKSKRDIFRFNGERPTAIDLGHVTHICLEGKKITFNFSATAMFVELLDEAAAESVFEALLNTWSAELAE